MRKTFLSLIFITSFLVCASTHTVANTYVTCDNDSNNLDNDSNNLIDTVGIHNTEQAKKKYLENGIPPAGELDTIGAKDALTRCEALPVNGTEKVAVLCYVASIKTPYSEKYGNVTVWLNDDVISTYGDIQAYRANCSAEVGAALAEHDRVLVVGNLSHTTYEKDGVTKDSYQIAQGAQLTIVKKAPGIENILLTEKVQKVIMDGVVYIVRVGKLFNLQGVQVR